MFNCCPFHSRVSQLGQINYTAAEKGWSGSCCLAANESGQFWKFSLDHPMVTQKLIWGVLISICEKAVFSLGHQRLGSTDGNPKPTESSSRATRIPAPPSSLLGLMVHQHGEGQRTPDKEFKALGSLPICLSTSSSFARDQTIFQL